MFKRKNNVKEKKVKKQTVESLYKYKYSILKNKNVIIMGSILVTLAIITGIIFYQENVKNIRDMGKSKNALEELVKSSNSIVENNITKIDVTGIELGKENEHTHLFKTMYNKDKHWEECTACGEKKNENTHTFRRTWALVTESCNNNNTYKDTCECGYYVGGYKSCVWSGKYITETNHIHIKQCDKCGEKIYRTYFLNTYGKGQIYQSTGDENCVMSNGNRLTCQNTGTCKICKHNFSPKIHAVNKRSGNEIYCNMCNKKFVEFTEEIIRDNNTPGTYTVINRVNLLNGAKLYESTKGMLRYDITLWQTNTQTVSNKNSTGTQFTLTSIGKIKNTAKTNSHTYSYCYISINGVPARTIFSNFEVKSDLIEPTITKIAMENGEEELTEWSRTKPIVIIGTENWTNTVNIEIIDDSQNKIFTGNAVVTNGSYTISCTPELEVDTSGKRFKVIVTDACNNKTEQKFEIAKIDAIAPKITSEDELGGDWAKSKKITFSANDYGIGEVQIGFNSSDDYILASKDGQSFSREYELFGDVYEPREANVYYKDGLGNISSKKIIINKLDNTAPSITNVNIHNNKLKVEANDIHETWGEGSGLVKYRYLTSEEKLENPKLTTENTIEVNKDEEIIINEVYRIKYIYVVAEDYVGNISEVYEFELPSLVLTSKVNLNTANGKGEIILDWSNYDISDKYFVIYRKEDDESEWKVIVSLEDKFNGNNYIDETANDKNKPNVPVINIEGIEESNSINIKSTSNDSGTKYIYYIESYDSSGNLLNKSN